MCFLITSHHTIGKKWTAYFIDHCLLYFNFFLTFDLDFLFGLCVYIIGLSSSPLPISLLFQCVFTILLIKGVWFPLPHPLQYGLALWFALAPRVLPPTWSILLGHERTHWGELIFPIQSHPRVKAILKLAKLKTCESAQPRLAELPT